MQTLEQSETITLVTQFSDSNKTVVEFESKISEISRFVQEMNSEDILFFSDLIYQIENEINCFSYPFNIINYLENKKHLDKALMLFQKLKNNQRNRIFKI